MSERLSNASATIAKCRILMATLVTIFIECDLQLLEDADSVYFGSTPDEQNTDDRDLADLDSSFQFRNHYSPRVKAFALRTVARDLVLVASGSKRTFSLLWHLLLKRRITRIIVAGRFRFKGPLRGTAIKWKGAGVMSAANS